MSGIKYWLPKNRYYELKYFCFQYPHFKELINKDNVSETVKEGVSKAIFNIENAIQDVNCDFPEFLLQVITTGKAYSKFASEKTEGDTKIPTSDEFFDAYRKYFYFLSKRKGI